MLAAPIRFEEQIVGLLEVFSPLPSAFTENESRVLQRLSEMTTAALRRARPYSIADDTGSLVPGSAEPASPQSLIDDFEADDDEPNLGAAEGGTTSRSRFYWMLSIIAVATVIVVSGFVIAPRLGGKIRSQGSSSAPAQPVVTQSPPVAPKQAPAKTVNPPNTLEDLRSLAEQGDPNAQFALGARYATGEQVKQDYPEAVKWFSKAADQGHVVAQATLGAYYWAGRGVPQDLGQAYFWSVLARAGGDEASKYRAAVLSSRMTRSQIAAVQQQADDWLRQHPIASNSSPAH